MTPERITDEEREMICVIFKEGNLPWFEFKRILDSERHARAALEESQQQAKDLKEDKRKIFAVHDEQCARSSEYYNELIFVKSKLEKAEQEKLRYKNESERLNSICKQLAGEELLFQEGKYETEMERLWNKLEEAQQTIANAKRIFETANAETDFDDVLHGMYEALGGNKEGSDKA